AMTAFALSPGGLLLAGILAAGAVGYQIGSALYSAYDRLRYGDDNGFGSNVGPGSFATTAGGAVTSLNRFDRRGALPRGFASGGGSSSSDSGMGLKISQE